MKLEEFHFMLGQTIMYCQVIEHDVKLIYASMLIGDYYDNIDKIEKWSLGQTVQKLKDLDLSDKKPYLSASDYNFLMQMTDKRNHWCHQAYQNFVYNDEFLYSKEYSDECYKLQRDNEKLSLVSDEIENLRIRVQKKYGRVWL